MIKTTTWEEKDKIIATDVLKNSGLILFPADTIIGLATQATEEGIAKLDLIKRRKSGKNYALIVDSLKTLKQLIDVDPREIEIITKNLSGYFTFIIKPEKIIDQSVKLLLSDAGTLGFRIPKSKLMIDLSCLSKKPLIATSANRSEEEPASNIKEALGKLQNELIDLVIDIKTDLSGQSSTVVDLRKNPPKILRQGSGIFIN